MADPVVIKNFRDTYVASATPKTNFTGSSRLRASTTSQALMYFGTPMPLYAKVQQGLLRFWNDAAVAGSVTITVQAISQTWSGSVVWDTRPNAETATFSITKNNPAADTMWEIPLDVLMQSVANGQQWWGIRVIASTAAGVSFYSSEAVESGYRPQALIQWSDVPEPPTYLAPSGGRAVASPKPILSYRFIDVSGNTTLGSHQIQISATNDFANLIFDSNWVNTTVPEMDLGTTSYGGATENQYYFWRARVRDGAGLQSEWSEPAQFTYNSKGVLASSSLSGPNGQGRLYVEDSTPTIVWTLSDKLQAAYQVQIFDLASPNLPIFDTGKISGTQKAIDTGSNRSRVLTSTSAVYRLTIRVWDQQTRESVPGSPLYYEYTRDFVYQQGAGGTAPSGLSVVQGRPYPWAVLTFQRSSPPDSFTIYRDGEVIAANELAANLFQSGTTYKYIDTRAAPRTSHVWAVAAKTNGIDSPKSLSYTEKISSSFTFMMNTDTSSPIVILKSGNEPGSPIEAEAQTNQEVHRPVGGAPVLLTQFVAGYEGSVEGVLSDGVLDGVTAQMMKERLKFWKKNPGREVLLYMVDEVLRVIPYNITYRPRAKSGGTTIYDVSFDFFQVNF